MARSAAVTFGPAARAANLLPSTTLFMAYEARYSPSKLLIIRWIRRRAVAGPAPVSLAAMGIAGHHRVIVDRIVFRINNFLILRGHWSA
jgi:hypothetical protein